MSGSVITVVSRSRFGHSRTCWSSFQFRRCASFTIVCPLPPASSQSGEQRSRHAEQAEGAAYATPSRNSYLRPQT